MTTVTVIASIEAQNEKSELIKTALLTLHKDTHAKDKGCIQYDLTLDNENPNLFVVIEIWQSAELLKTHIDSDHFKAFMAETEGSIANFDVKQLTKFA
jgi:quinol monooxygenase YgiN